MASKDQITEKESSGEQPKGKIISAREREIANQSFKHANEAALKANYDYAINLYTQCSKLVPDNLLYRQSLHGVLKKKYGDNKKGGRMASVRVIGPKGKVKKAQLQKNYLQVLDYCEGGLQYNPWDVGLLSDEADALAKLGYVDVGVFVLTEALQVDRENPGVNRQLGKLFEQQGEFEKAIACWERVKKVVPTDEEADRQIKNLAAHETMRLGRMGDESSAAGPERSGTAQIDKTPAPTADPIAELEGRIKQDPANAANYVQLAKHYRKAEDLARAQQLLKKAVALPKGEEYAREELDNVNLDILQHNVSTAERRSEDAPADPETHEKLKKAQAKFATYELDVYRRRFEHRPQDLGLRYDLATRLVEAGQVDEAIPHFQGVRGDPRRGFQALLRLSQCFEAKKNFKLALRSLQDALKTVGPKDAEGTKEVHYQLGCLYVKLDQPSEAEEHFNEVAALDYGYRDVAQRLEQLQE